MHASCRSYWDFTWTEDEKQELPLPAPGAMLCGDVTPSAHACCPGDLRLPSPAHGTVLDALGVLRHATLRPSRGTQAVPTELSALAAHLSTRVQAATTLLLAATTPRCTSTISSRSATEALSWR